MRLNNIQIKLLLFTAFCICFMANTNMSDAQIQTDSDGPMWNPQNSGTNTILRDVHFFNADTGVVIGHGGTYLVTTNGGITWNLQSIGVTEDLLEVKFRNNTGYICGGPGIVLKTTNRGTTWVDVSPNTQAYLYDLSFLNANTCTVVGDGGIILRTTNGGTNWVSTSTNLLAIQAIEFIDPNTGFAVGFQGGMVKTTNGGVNWSNVTSGTTNLMYDITFIGNTGYFGGVAGVLRKSTNGGNNWTSLNSGTTDIILDINFIDENTGYICGNSSMIKKTTNGGTTWQTQTATGNTFLYNLWLDSPNSGTAVGMTGTILRSVGVPVPGAPVNLTFSVLDTGKVQINWIDSSNVEDGFVIQRKDNLDTNWAAIDTVMSDTTAYTDSGLDIGKTYYWRVYAYNAAGNSSYSNEVSTLITNIPSNGNNTPDKYALYQNYPNPFNPSTKINFDIPVEGHVRMSVFDILGREVAVLVNESKLRGSYSINWNAANLNSGIYFYKLEAESFTQTRKMLLLK